ncbi:hypothetical protein [Caldimonas tepidiphila]|uniref:hypothetical protein n=1 Tax=Caldimonas tepidiphila TaxID=2315841 RepID=UPI000E5A7B1C|nr:hypothetical protein [Caldimonas tepidiphila]
MLPPSPPADAPASPIPLQWAAGLQDDLLIATHDLERLQALLAHAGEQLMQQFSTAVSHLQALTAAAEGGQRIGTAEVAPVMRDLGGAVTSLQFQDMASQLIGHTQARLRHCADRLARDAMGEDDEDGGALVASAPERPNPVTQSEMDAGSVELF